MFVVGKIFIIGRNKAIYFLYIQVLKCIQTQMAIQKCITVIAKGYDRRFNQADFANGRNNLGIFSGSKYILIYLF